MSETISRFIEAQNNLVVQHSDFSLRALFDMAEENSIDLTPKYQRRDRWNKEKQSALIESFILNVPVPPVYLSEDDFGKYSVIDGKQRITAIRDFLSGELRLTGLTKFPELEGCHFSDLPPQLRNALSVRPYIRVITLLRQTNPDLKYEVFLRLNTGGEKLLSQEIRNVAFSGPLNDLLLTLSANDFLRSQMKIKNESSTAYRNMDDVEHVLRFFTIADRWQQIGQVLSQEMDRYMQENRFPSSRALNDMAQRFEFSLNACEAIWGNKAFYKPQAGGWRSQFISPLYDAEMVAVLDFTDAQISSIRHNRTRFLNAFSRVFQDDTEFEKAVTRATNNPNSIRRRISTVRSLLSQYC